MRTTFLVPPKPLCYHRLVSAADDRIDVRVFPAFRGKASAGQLRRLAEEALEAGQGPPGASLSLVLADDATVRRLNRDYRGLDQTTDVLAFAFNYPGSYEGEGDPPSTSARGLDGGPFVTAPQEEGYLGEVVISYSQCVRQAVSQGRQVEQELAHVLTHGVLHLLGYDHLSDEEERVMREREATALAGAGFRPERP